MLIGVICVLNRWLCLPCILLDVKAWDDETDMQKLEEEAVRSVQMEGLRGVHVCSTFLIFGKLILINLALFICECVDLVSFDLKRVKLKTLGKRSKVS